MTSPPSPQAPSVKGSSAERARAYWQANLKLLSALLFIWFSVSYGCGVLFVESLNRVTLPGTSFPLGFWFAQQGSIYVFLLLIFVYCRQMSRLDQRFGFSEDQVDASSEEATR